MDVLACWLRGLLYPTADTGLFIICWLLEENRDSVCYTRKPKAPLGVYEVQHLQIPRRNLFQHSRNHPGCICRSRKFWCTRFLSRKTTPGFNSQGFISEFEGGDLCSDIGRGFIPGAEILLYKNRGLVTQGEPKHGLSRLCLKESSCGMTFLLPNTKAELSMPCAEH